jgi:hypothetical protein
MFIDAMKKPPQPKKPKTAKTTKPLTGKELAKEVNKYQGLARVSRMLGNLWS